MKIYLLIILLSTVLSNAQNLIPYSKNEKMGLSDTAGNIVLPIDYTTVGFYSSTTNGYGVKKEGKYGLLDKNLKISVLPISLEPIYGAGDFLIITNSSDELSLYDKKTYKFVRNESTNNTDLTSNEIDPGYSPSSPSFTREKVLALFLEKLGKQYKNSECNVANINDQYFGIYVEENNKRKTIGMFLPRTSTFLLNDINHSYRTAVWIPSKKEYFITVNSDDLLSGIVNQDKKIIFPFKKYSVLYIMPQYIGYKEAESTAKNNSKAEYFRIISSNTDVKNQFSNFRYLRSISQGDNEFEVFKGTVNNYSLHKTNEVYIGENGKKYFEVDYELEY